MPLIHKFTRNPHIKATILSLAPMIMTPFADFSWAFLPFLPSWGPSPCLLGPLPLLPRWSHTQLYACKLQTYSPCLGSTPVSISNFRAGRGCERFLEPILLHQFFLFTITFSQTRNLGRFHLIPFSPLNNSILMIHPWVLPSSSFFPRRKTKKSYPLKLLHYSKKFSPLDSRLLAILFTWGNLAEHARGCACECARVHTHSHTHTHTLRRMDQMRRKRWVPGSSGVFSIHSVVHFGSYPWVSSCGLLWWALTWGVQHINTPRCARASDGVAGRHDGGNTLLKKIFNFKKKWSGCNLSNKETTAVLLNYFFLDQFYFYNESNFETLKSFYLNH